jgi:uncharacterized protein (TIGR02231 family)
MPSTQAPKPQPPPQKRRSYQGGYKGEAATSSRSNAPAAAPAMPSADYGYDDSVQMESVASVSREPTQTSIGFSLAPPPSFRPPATMAGGYDLAFRSLQRETVPSGKGVRRVPLLAQNWPVKVERKLFPGVAPEGFLVAELESPSTTPLPGGVANLFVGADPAGQARLDLISPKEKFTLPLGLDHAIRPVRNVRLVTQEKGLIGKDDLTTYVTTIELANPYRIPIAVKVKDQWPTTDDKNVEVKLLETKPYAIQDTVKGTLEWHLTLSPSSKTNVSFTYSIRRPKGWRLHQ